jgi:predicted TIM-barrel fold metal-dependent hydrolase
MDVVDSQVHLNRFGPNWQTVDPTLIIEYATMTMDAVGVDAVLIDEWAGWDEKMHYLPGYVLPNGAFRSQLSFSERSVALHPERFGFAAHIDPTDPDVDDLVTAVHTQPGGLCVRVVPLPQTGQLELFKNGGYDRLFAAAQTNGLPICCFLQGRSQLIEPVLQRFPDLQLVLDHCGVDSAAATNTRSDRVAQLEEVISLAQYPNLALKWCHAPSRFSEQAYPFEDCLPLLRRVVDAFTPQRVMWGSDHTQSKPHHTWAQALYYLLDSQVLSDEEKEWMLGRTAREIFRWPSNVAVQGVKRL